jgi:hypothetical protein
MVTLAFGERRVVVPRTTVDELLRAAGALAEMNPSALRLMHGETSLYGGTYLGDYPALLGPTGMELLVSSAGPAWRDSSQARPQGAPAVISRMTEPPASPAQLVGAGELSYNIFVDFEELPTMEPVVVASMQVRQLRLLVAAFSGVPSDTVFLQFAGSVLDADRQLSDPPAIRSGAHVYAFFTIARALQCVLRLMQGGNPPPPTTPPPTQAFGPALPPGYVRQAPPSPPSGSLTMRLGTGGRTSASERLRSTFNCPKFLGETRHWKGWNQGFVRFLAINHLDYVVEEDFPTAHLSLEQQMSGKKK